MARRRNNRVAVVRRRARRDLPLILTVGHSTRTRRELIELLKAHAVKQLLDVRTVPRSRHNPQFNRNQLPRALRRAGIDYRHMAGLGGLRHARRDSINTAWRNLSFRGFADYMQTDEFLAAIKKLTQIAKRRQVALMCAEAVPWRCHRSLIGDALLVRGYPVDEIQSATRTRPHSLTPWARVKGTQITYPLEPGIAARQTADTSPERRMAMIQLKRVYDKVRANDGKRFLVERLWPRGVKKTSLRLDAWLKDVGPSDGLRRWFGHNPKRWEGFCRRYFQELKKNRKAYEPILKVAQHRRATLIYSSHDTEHNNAVALKKFLEVRMKKSRTPGRIRQHRTAA